MARILREIGLRDSRILAIDTWLGSRQFWEPERSPSLYRALRLENGYPQVYRQFMFNVIHSGFAEMIIPFPQTASAASRWLKEKGVLAPLIYIDAGHDEEDVSSDLRNYYEILEPGGMIFGDDLGDPSGNVQKAVTQFFSGKNLTYETREDQFWIFNKK